MATGAVIARIITQYSNKGSKAAQRDITKLGKQFDDFSKRVFKAFAVAGAAAAAFAVKIGKDAVQAAMDDQKSQLLLANALRNTVGATDENISATEAYISAMQKQFAIADDDLRPSLAALAAVTGDLAEAQSLQNIAVDVAAGTGRDLASVTQAIVKAYQGNLGALRRLGVPLDENIVKSRDFNAAMKALSTTFAGAGTTSANTFAGQLRGLQLTYGEIIEELGYALIPVLQNLASFITNNVLPALQAWVTENKDQVVTSLQSVIDFGIKAGKTLAKFVGFISDNLQTLKNFAAIMIGVFVGGKVYAGIVAITGAISALRIAFAAQTAAATSAAVATTAATGGANLLAAAAALAAFAAATGITLAALNNTEDTTAAIGENLVTYNSHLKDLNKSYKTGSKETQTTFNNLLKSFGAAKKVTAEEQKRIEIQQAINKAKLSEFGIKNVSTTDPISLEAARLNLVKEANIAEMQRFEAMLKFNESQKLANELASRYADILTVISDRQITSAEVAALAAKWGQSEEAVIKYLSYVTNAPLPQGWNDPGKQAADGWNIALNALNNYYKGLGAAPIPTLPNPPSVTSPVVPIAPVIPNLPTIPNVPAVVAPSLPLPTGGMGGVGRGEYVNSQLEVPTFQMGGVQRGEYTKIEVTVNEGRLTDEGKKAVVDAIVEASGSGTPTNWFRTTGRTVMAI